MKWGGKLVGGAFGALAGGPVGTILGLIAGHLVDDKLEGDAGAREALRRRPLHRVEDAGVVEDEPDDEGEAVGDPKAVNALFFQVTFEVMGHVAKADGRVSDEDIRSARAVMMGFRLTEAQMAQAIGLVGSGLIVALIVLFVTVASWRGVDAYATFVEGAKEGFGVATRIVPFLVAILVAIGMFRGAGGIDALKALLAPVLVPLGFPPELLPMTLMRPLSGSATTALFTEVVQSAGPDSLVARMGGTIFGSTETTFYVIAVYFGSVAIRRPRHALAAGLTADFFGVVASVVVCRLMFG